MLLVFGHAFGDDDPFVLHTFKDDGTSRIKLAGGTDAYIWDAEYSPNGGRIAYSRQSDMRGDIWLMKANGTSKRRVAGSRHWEDSPTWAPDGKRLAFFRSYGRDGDSGIFVVRLRTGKVRSLVRVPTKFGYPTDLAWSPDGRSIAFSRTVSTYYTDLFRFDVASGKLNRLSRTPLLDESDADWSPNGKRLVWSRGKWRDGRYRSRLVTADRRGTAPVRLASGHSPAWSPDGHWIAFSKVTGYETECCESEYPYNDIFKIRADGSELTKVLELDQEYPEALDWQPR